MAVVLKLHSFIFELGLGKIPGFFPVLLRKLRRINTVKADFQSLFTDYDATGVTVVTFLDDAGEFRNLVRTN